LYGLDNTIVADIQAPIIQTFGSVEKLGWLGVGFPLGSIASILGIGKAFGIFDVKWVYIISLLNFVGGSALCGGAPNMDAEIVGRVWAGLGGAGMYLGVLNVLSLNTSPKERSIYIAGCAMVWGLGKKDNCLDGNYTNSSSRLHPWSSYRW
jgi:MFS family permease